MSIEQFSNYIYDVNGYSAIKVGDIIKEVEGNKNMRTEKLLSLSIIINVILSLIVVLSFIAFDSFFAYAAYGYFN